MRATTTTDYLAAAGSAIAQNTTSWVAAAYNSGGASRILTRGLAAGSMTEVSYATSIAGSGAFTADNFPVFDWVRPNVYAVLDSNHGYKMIGVGREVAKVLLGEHAPLLQPFRFERFATGDLHPVSSSPYPWS